jgi:hypothetical protein
MLRSTPGQNHRAALRQKVLKTGKIVLPGDLTVVDCTIRDVSDTGARLEVGDPAAIPARFRLVQLATNTMRDAIVMWRRDRLIGVAFITAPRRAPLLKF